MQLIKQISIVAWLNWLWAVNTGHGAIPVGVHEPNIQLKPITA